MWAVHTLQRHFCVVALFLGCLTTYISLRNDKSTELIEPNISSYENESLKQLELQNLLGYRDVYTGYRNHFRMPKFFVQNNGSNSDKAIYILGLFELSTKLGKRHEGLSEIAAAHLAVKHVNEFNVLPGYSLKLITNDTKCDPGVGVDRLFHALYSNKVILMLLGAGCSNVTESLANIVPHWNIMQVSFGSTSPVLSDRNKFPLFFRTAAPDSSHNSARISFIKHFGWKTVIIFSLSQQAYLLSLNNLVKELETANISCSATITFSLDNYKEQLKVLQGLDTRIIIGSFSSAIAPKIFCEAYNLHMYGNDYIWLLLDQNKIWWNSSAHCIQDTLQKATDGLFLVSEYNSLSKNESSVSGLTNGAFENQLNMTKSSISKYAPHTYDAVWAMALVIRKTAMCQSAGFINTFGYDNAALLKQFMTVMDFLSFTGISGPVKFNGADRIGNSAFKQIQGGNLHHVAVYYAENGYLNFKCQGCKNIKWQQGKIPIAQRIKKYRLVTIPKLAFFFVLAFSAIGMAISMVFLYFNLHFRRMRTVKLSSPRLNNIVVMGCILVYIAVILLGLDHATISLNKRFSQICTARIYLLSAGFSLTFGSIFAKTYRVHRIFTYSGTSLVKDKLLKDKQLIGLIFVLLLIDGLIVVLWIAFDPMERQLRDLPLDHNTGHLGVVYQPQVEVCRSQNTTGWFIAIYSYKGFLLIVGVYMAWETRHIKIPSLNDSQYIGICVYSEMSSAIIVVLSNFLADYTTFSYLATALSILIATTITLVLLFVPKLKSVFGRVNSEDAIVQSMGLKTEFNTRRLIFNDPRELLYRMEVQNRVYLNEIQALDKEIARLEELFATPSLPSLQSTSKCEPFVICKQVGNLTLPQFPSAGRASWPSLSKNAALENPRFFVSDNELLQNKTSHEYFSTIKIFDKLKRFFGKIPSVWILNIKEHDIKSNILRDSAGSHPQLSSYLFVPNNEMVRTKSDTGCFDDM